jgi:hypothetical protein
MQKEVYVVGRPLTVLGDERVPFFRLDRLATGIEEGEPALLKLELLQRTPHDDLLRLDFIAQVVEALHAELEFVDRVCGSLFRRSHSLAQVLQLPVLLHLQRTPIQPLRFEGCQRLTAGKLLILLEIKRVF